MSVPALAENEVDVKIGLVTVKRIEVWQEEKQ